MAATMGSALAVASLLQPSRTFAVEASASTRIFGCKDGCSIPSAADFWDKKAVDAVARG